MSISVEFWIPMSPSEEMVTQLMVLAASIRLHGGELAANAKIGALVHPDGDEMPLRKRKKQLDELGIEVVWVEKKEFERYSYNAAGFGRMRETFSSDVVVLLDADTLVAGPLDEIVEACYKEHRLYGLIANTPPPYWQTDETSREIWIKLFAGAGLPEPVFSCEHSGWNRLFFNERDRYCPPYFNFGVVLAPAPVISNIGQVINGELNIVNSIYPDAKYFAGQFALALAIQKLSINYGILDLKYNFPITHKQFLDVSDQYLKDIRVFHYLGDWEGDLRRGRDFADLTTVGEFIIRCQDSTKLNSFINALKPVYSRIVYPWLWNGYSVAEKAGLQAGNIANEIIQILDESASWACNVTAETKELKQKCLLLSSRVQELEASSTLFNGERCELYAQLNALKGSLSWRITAPVRYVGRILHFADWMHIYKQFRQKGE